MTNTTASVDDMQAKLQAELVQTETRRTRAEQEVGACVARINELTHRLSAIHTATAALASLPPAAPDQEWLDHLNAWHRTLCEELRALPSTIRDAKTLGVQKNLILSIRAIEHGPDVANGTGYDLTNLRLGALMREAGFEPTGADPDRNYSGVMPWFGSLSQVERRVTDWQKQRAEAEARLAEALLDDAERERRTAETKARIDALNAAPVRKIRGDGSMYERHADGRIVEIAS
jgi:hypothetical protein